MTSSRGIIPALVLLTLLAFAPALRCGFVNYDDPAYVYENSHVMAGLTANGFLWAWTTVHTGYWHPLTWLSLMLDSQVYGAGPRGYHLTNVLLHVLNVTLLYLVLVRLTASRWRSAAVAALFAVHPLRVESVAWISERKDVLSTCFGLLALLAYTRYVQTLRWREYLLVLSFMALSLMAKPMLVTLPGLLLLLDYWPLGRLRIGAIEAAGASLSGPLPGLCPARTSGALLREKLPLLGLSAVSSIGTLLVVHRSSGMNSLASYGFGLRATNAAVAYFNYAVKLLWPVNLAVLYPLQVWPAWRIALAAVFLMVGTALVIWQIKVRPWLVVGWFWFLGVLAPVSGLMQAGAQSMADRYTYLSTMGLLLMLVWSIPSALPRVRSLATAVLGAVLVMMVGLTWRQCGYWRDGVTLFRRDIAVTFDNAIARLNLGEALRHEGQVRESLDQFERAIALDPQNVSAYNTLAFTLLKLDDPTRAQSVLRAALMVDPKNAEACANLGEALVQQNQTQAAVELYRHALELDPKCPSAHIYWGRVLAAQGQTLLAKEHFDAALSLNPDEPDAHEGLGLLLVLAGNLHQAIPHFRQALAGNPQDAHLHYDLGAALMEAGQAQQARRHLEESLRLAPDDADLRESVRQVLSHGQIAGGGDFPQTHP